MLVEEKKSQELARVKLIAEQESKRVDSLKAKVEGTASPSTHINDKLNMSFTRTQNSSKDWWQNYSRQMNSLR